MGCAAMRAAAAKNAAIERSVQALRTKSPAMKSGPPPEPCCLVGTIRSKALTLLLA
jgi:hypothetical protein